MHKISIFDASPFVYAGDFANSASKLNGFRYGGLRMLIDSVMYDALIGRNCIVCFDTYTGQSSVQRTYKKNRKSNTSIIAQADLAREWLEQLGIACVSEEFVEADDIICAAVEELEQNEDVYQITVYSDDLDLAHCVSGLTVLNPASSNGVQVTPNNFSQVCSDGKARVLYNTISAFKVFTGCKSDTIPPLPDGYAMYARFKDYWLEENALGPSEELKSPYYLARFLQDKLLDELSEEKLQEILDRISLIYPSEYKMKDGMTFTELALSSNIKNKELAKDIARLTRCKKNLKLLGSDYGDISREILDTLKLRAELLSEGVYAVNSGIPAEMDLLPDYSRGF